MFINNIDRLKGGNKYSKNQKILMNKISFIYNFTYADNAVKFSLGSVKK